MPGNRWKFLPLALGLGLAIRYLFHNHLYAVDDSYITFRYAEHFARGEGLVFNLGERYYGTTAAGYALLLGTLRAVTRLEIPVLAEVLSAVGLGLVAFHVCLRVWKGLAPALAATVGCFVVAFVFMAPMSSVVPGHETYWFLGLVAIGLTLTFDLGRPASGMSMLVLAATTRPDGVMFVLLVGAMNLFRARSTKAGLRRAMLINAGPAVALAVWLVGLRSYFGQFLPGTMAAKHALYMTSHWTAFDWRTVQIGLDLYLGVGWPAALFLAIAASIWLIKRSLPYAELAWLVFFAVSLAFYCNAKVIYCAWYVIPACFALFAAAGRLVVEVAEQNPRRPAWIAAAVMCGVLTPRATEGMFGFATERQANGHLVAYQPVIDFLRREDPQGTSVAIMEPGNFGYQLGPEYFVVDVLGLSTPGVAAALLAKDFGYAMRTYRPKYFALAYGMPFSPDADEAFAAGYEKVGEFYAGADNSPVGVTTLYRARP